MHTEWMQIELPGPAMCDFIVWSIAGVDINYAHVCVWERGVCVCVCVCVCLHIIV